MTTTSSSLPLPTTPHSPKLCLIFLSTFFTLLLLLFQIQSLKPPFPFFSTSNPSPILSKLRDSITFLPLKDLRFSHSPTSGHTWFISSLPDTYSPNEPEHISFPSPTSKNRLLCLSAYHPFDGTQNSYALAFPHALPYNSTLLNGLTFISDTYYDYSNLWHGLSAIVPFVAWHQKNKCVRPERWVLFHWGELRTKMGQWVKTLAEVSIGNEVKIEGSEGGGDKGEVFCFEKAVVFRHNEGGMGRERKEEVYDMMRCKGRDYCKIVRKVEDLEKIRLTLLLRVGGRAFKNETAVIEIFDKECRRVDGCKLKVARPDNLTFCDQVRLMTETDILVSAHGAQMTNMIFMDKNSSVMEFFPKGWLELAGVGQYVFRWLADWSGMRHQGQWRDPFGDECPYSNKADCFTFYKDGKIGHDEAFFANWIAAVLKEVKDNKLGEASKSRIQPQVRPSACSCS